MIKQLKFQRLLAMIYIGASMGIVHFWWQFFNGDLFERSELEVLIPHFDAYYLWERSFVIPELMLAFGMLVSSIPLWTNKWMDLGRVMAASCAGASLFLGGVDLTYGFNSGLYALSHDFADVILEVALSITAVGVLAFVILLFAPKHDN
jgi:hypothetical protein